MAGVGFPPSLFLRLVLLAAGVGDGVAVAAVRGAVTGSELVRPLLWVVRRRLPAARLCARLKALTRPLLVA
jgi:hypothetical protein